MCPAQGAMCLEGAVALAVPLTVDVGIGENWKEAKG
jgi:DNA polymerase I-like protein with 3'-5' exonuclease and polymerase domains